MTALETARHNDAPMAPRPTPGPHKTGLTAARQPNRITAAARLAAATLNLFLANFLITVFGDTT